MQYRLPDSSTQVINRQEPVTIHFQGKAIEAFEGDTVATALHAAGIRVMNRSFKYHRPRGIMDMGVHAAEPAMNVDGRTNERICRTPVRNGMRIEPESRLKGDFYAVSDHLSWAMPTGFYYKTLYKPKWVWKKIIPAIRKAPGNLGEIRPLEKMQRFDRVTLTPELLVVGGGLAGLEAARVGAEAGVRVVLVEAEPWLGGFERYQGEENLPVIQNLSSRLKGMANVEILTTTTAAAVYPDGLVCCIRQCCPEEPFFEINYMVRPKTVVLATGAMDRPLLFNHNDRPGVMLPQTAQRFIHLFRLKPGHRALVAGADNSVYKVAIDLAKEGVEVVGLVDSRVKNIPEHLQNSLTEWSIPLLPGHMLVEAHGKEGVTGAKLVNIGGTFTKTFSADTIIASCGRTPLFKLLAQTSTKSEYNKTLGFHLPKDYQPGYFAAGRLLGLLDPAAIRAQGRLAGARALATLGVDTRSESASAEGLLSEAPDIEPNPRQIPVNQNKNRRFICFANDVTEKDIDTALSEGFEHTEMIKRYTTATMGREQGAVSQANFLEYLAHRMPDKLGAQKITTPRPPLVGLSMGVLSAGIHDQPRLSPLHHIQIKQGGKPIRTGPWIRIEHFGNPEKESLAVRKTAGLCDVSTLGKFRIFGTDSEKLINRVNTKGIAGLAKEKILYSAACNEEGVFIDDGIFIKQDDHDFYFTTSTARGPATMEWYARWRREENWKVYMVNLTEAYAGMNLSGPRARDILSRLTDTDLSNESMPFMHWKQMEIAGVQALVFRMGFLGELSYEIHCPASTGTYLWEKIIEGGTPSGLRAVGLETQLTCRLEKGHVLPGLDTDGNTSLFEANMDWLWDRTKDDTIGGPMLKLLADKPFKNQVIGFSLDGRPGLMEGNIIVDGTDLLGYITSVRYSTFLEKTIGLALVKPHAEWKEGGHVTIVLDGKEIKAHYTHPPFYDPKGERLRG